MHDPGINKIEKSVSSIARDVQLDLLRGIAVAGMFFYSFTFTLSDSLPLLLSHNITDKLLPGDLVLSLFLFCSGISLALVRERHQQLRDVRFWSRLVTRIGHMVFVSIFITPFSVGRVLGMDEMMLNVVLTIPALLIIGFGSRVIWSTVVGIWILYLVLAYMSVIPEPPSQYLGGYPMALFWLPILLGGTLAYFEASRDVWLKLSIFLTLLVTAVLVDGWPNKMRVNPAFGALSVAFCLLVLATLRSCALRCKWLEYFGSKPLRMWVLLFCLLGPVRLYGETQLKRSVLQLSPTSAVLISVCWMWCSYCISRGWDRLVAKFAGDPISTRRRA